MLYGIDWIAPLDCDATADFVEVAPTRNPFSPYAYTQLQERVNPFSNMGDHGIDQYVETVFCTNCYLMDASSILIYLSNHLLFNQVNTNQQRYTKSQMMDVRSELTSRK